MILTQIHEIVKIFLNSTYSLYFVNSFATSFEKVFMPVS